MGHPLFQLSSLNPFKLFSHQLPNLHRQVASKISSLVMLDRLHQFQLHQLGLFPMGNHKCQFSLN